MFSRPVSSGWKPVPTSSRLDDPAADHGPAGGRLGDAAEDFQQRALAGAVAADDADDLALGWTSKETSRRAQKVSSASCLVP